MRAVRAAGVRPMPTSFIPEFWSQLLKRRDEHLRRRHRLAHACLSARQAGTSRVIKTGIVGLGWWGRTIAATLAESRHIRLVAAADVHPDAAKIAGSHDLTFTTDVGQLLASPQIDAVILCTPHTLHCDQIVRAAAAGKHVFCEKPLALTRADAVRAIEACNTARVVLAIGHERRFEPPAVDLRRHIEAGELGTLLQIEANFSQDKFLSLQQGSEFARFDVAAQIDRRRLKPAFV